MDKKGNMRYLLILLIFLLPACEQQAPPITPSGRVVKIGVIGPMSGPDKAMGLETLRGIKLSIHMNPYLKNGDKIELVTRDDRDTPKLTVKALDTLARSERITSVLLLSASASCLAAKTVANSQKVPTLVILGTHPDITKNTKFVSQICFDNTFQGKVAALFVYDELLLDEVAVFNDSDSFYSTSLADEFVKQFMKIGGDITDIVSLKAGKDNDYKALLSNVRKHKPDLLYLPVNIHHAFAILQAIQSMGWYPECMTGEGLLAQALSHYPDDIHLFDGLLSIDFYSSTVPLTPYGKRAVREFKRLYGYRGNPFTALGVEGMDILRYAMNRCEIPNDRACVNDKIRDTKNFEGLMGRITIRPDGKAERPLIVNRIRGGKIYGVVKVY